MRLQLAIVVLLLGCGGSRSMGSKAPEGSSRSDARGGFSEGSSTSSPMVGTSDGVTCEEARERNVEEIDMQGGTPDLTASDLGSVLNNGAYLSPCDVPETSRVQICVAVRAGQAVGVTVALAPSNPEVELCVARQVRSLSFPPNPKMDIATVRF